jgi:hypothetical protein
MKATSFLNVKTIIAVILLAISAAPGLPDEAKIAAEDVILLKTEYFKNQEKHEFVFKLQVLNTSKRSAPANADGTVALILIDTVPGSGREGNIVLLFYSPDLLISYPRRLYAADILRNPWLNETYLVVSTSGITSAFYQVFKVDVAQTIGRESVLNTQQWPKASQPLASYTKNFDRSVCAVTWLKGHSEPERLILFSLRHYEPNETYRKTEQCPEFYLGFELSSLQWTELSLSEKTVEKK